MRLKTCKACKTKFVPIRPMQSCCDIPCAITHANNLKAKNARKEHKADKEKLKSRRDWLREAQQAFNYFIRSRDSGNPCISCGKPTKNGDHAGHWKPTSTSPELRFHEDNVHLQCVQCNLYLHGNVANYRARLLQLIGQERVSALEGVHLPKHYSIDDLKEIKAKYAKLAKELKK